MTAEQLEPETVELNTPLIAFTTLLDKYYCNIYKIDSTVDIQDPIRKRDIQERMNKCHILIEQVKAFSSEAKLDLFELSYVIATLFDEVHRLVGSAVLHPEFPYPDISQFYFKNMMVFLGHTKDIVRKELTMQSTNNTIH